MKTLLITLFFSFIAKFTFAQTDTLFFDSDWKKCPASQAEHRVLIRQAKNYVANDFDLNGNLQMRAELISVAPFIKEGKTIFFDENGNKSSEGNYKNNNRFGIWTWWINNGKDSIINEYDENGFKRRIRPAVENKKDSTFTIVEEMPQFPGGEEAMLKFIGANTHYPASALKDSIEGRVLIRFVVTKSGTIEDAKVMKSIRSDLDEAAMNAVNSMPQWKPGTQNGRPVGVYFNIPINFTLPKKN